jgi:hypothetical protein
MLDNRTVIIVRWRVWRGIGECYTRAIATMEEAEAVAAKLRKDDMNHSVRVDQPLVSWYNHNVLYSWEKPL